MSTISPVSTTQNNSAITSASSSQSVSQTLSGLNLDANSFLKMFTAEIANQDPLNPMDQSSFLNQIAQMTQVQSASELSDTLNNLGTAMSSSLSSQQITEATGFLGRNIQYTDANGATQQGTVSAIQLGSDGTPQLLVGGNSVGLSSVQYVLQ